MAWHTKTRELEVVVVGHLCYKRMTVFVYHTRPVYGVTVNQTLPNTKRVYRGAGILAKRCQNGVLETSIC